MLPERVRGKPVKVLVNAGIDVLTQPVAPLLSNQTVYREGLAKPPLVLSVSLDRSESDNRHSSVLTPDCHFSLLGQGLLHKP